MASKTLRHSKLSITVDTYGHLMPYATQQAVDAIADALAAAELRIRDEITSRLAVGQYGSCYGRRGGVPGASI
jgi:HEAT repeat protein